MSNKNQKQILLVSGFVRNIEQLHNLKDTPSVINDIIHLYQRLCDEWDRKYSHKDIEIDEMGCIVTANSDSQITAYGSTIVTDGIYKWKMKIISLKPDSYGCIYVGVIQDNEKYLRQYQNNITWDYCGYQISRNGIRTNIRYTRKAKHYDCNWSKVDDTLEITLDLYGRKLKFDINDNTPANAFKHIRKAKYRLVLSISYGKDTAVQLL